ncbi:hypothetical protein FRB96_004949 [Tulasnella sp. 330]|nr:hypothetical protein FRB96_004949 [Tulasnella sp. 330]
MPNDPTYLPMLGCKSNKKKRDEYLAPIPEDERHDLMTAYHKRLTSDNIQLRTEAAKAWSKWEMSTSKLRINQEDIARAEADEWAL